MESLSSMIEVDRIRLRESHKLDETRTPATRNTRTIGITNTIEVFYDTLNSPAIHQTKEKLPNPQNTHQAVRLTIMAENAPSDSSRGMPFYEKLRRDLRETLQKKRILDQSIVCISFHIPESTGSG
jgi:hypothetical protein